MLYSFAYSPFARCSSSMLLLLDGFFRQPPFARIRSVERFISSCSRGTRNGVLSLASKGKVTSIRTGSNETTPKKSRKSDGQAAWLCENGSTLGDESPKLSIRRVHAGRRKGLCIKAGEEIKLRPKVYETLKYLVEHPGRLIGKQELMQAVWPDAFVTDDSLVQCTLELRRALDDRSQQLLKTVPRRGYLFTAEGDPALDASQTIPVT